MGLYLVSFPQHFWDERNLPSNTMTALRMPSAGASRKPALQGSIVLIVNEIIILTGQPDVGVCVLGRGYLLPGQNDANTAGGYKGVMNLSLP
jgi:hypothetical protein